MKNLTCIFFFLLLSFFSLSCKTSKEKDEKQEVTFVTQSPKVKVATLKETSFSHSIYSNGKLEAIKKVDLKFENQGIIQRLLVNDGDIVKKGQVIALQKSNFLNIEKTKNNELLTNAYLNMEDILLGFDYSISDTLNVPKDILKMAKSRSGIAEAKYQISQTKKKQLASRLIAPFSGIIANVSAKENSLSSTSEKVCTLINNTKLLVSFYIIENEFGLVKKGDVIEVTPLALSNKKFQGQIKYINPIVNENGLILIKAIVDNKNNTLIDGMNVNLKIKKVINNVLAIPKNAIVDRQDQKVVFTVNNKKSKWNYITTGIENKDSIIVTNGLQKNDTIIIDGQINLAHDTPVKQLD